MLVRLVNAVLQRFLGQYVENLDTERLSYSLGYSGNVVLTDLHLKADALSHILGLPLRLKSGLIARVQLSIPLTQLRSQPWCITIEDADLVVYPSDRDDIATDSAPSNATTTSAGVTTNDNIIEESRKAYLDRLESRWWQVVREGGLVDAVATTSPTDSSWWSYGVSLIYGVVSNLHVEIRNVHFSIIDENGLIGGHFTWGICLERMTIQATDASWNPTGRSSNQQIEFKSIDIVGFSIYYMEEERIKQYYLVPPSQFSVHLLRRTTPELLTSESTPRIEVEAKLTALDVDVSQGVLTYSYRLVDFFRRQSAPSRRPLARPLKQPAAWWRYAAGEVVPALRRQNWGCQSPDLMLQRLAEAAALTNRYVRAYEAHLLRGLCLDSDDNSGKIGDHEALEATMPLDRVILLRQVAMQRAARTLRQQKPLEKRSKDPPTANNQRSQSWWPSFLTSTNTSDTAATEGGSMAEAQSSAVGEEEDEAPRPWRLWWWFSTAPPPPSPQTALNTEAEVTTTAASAEAALMLLNELVAARDIGQVLTHDRLFCRLTCRVDRFRLGLQEKDDQSLCSLRADNLQLCVETRPREESLHFSARLHSLLVRDERCRDGQQRPFFPIVISPLLHAPSSPSSDLFRLDYTSAQLANEASSPPASLNIRTDPLRVVCQPELFNRVVRFLAYAFNNASNQAPDDSSAYDTIKSHTKANLRAALHNVETAVEGPTATTTTSSIAVTPLQTSLISLHLDIAAPRILFPGRLWPSLEEAEAEREGIVPCPPASLLGVICDLGRFRFSNWEPSATTATNSCENDGQVRTLAEQTNEAVNGIEERAGYDGDDGSDMDEESDVFATPCGTPVQSDSETPPMESPKRLSSAQRRSSRKRPQRSRKLYVTYLLELDEFRILAGRLDELQVSGLWPDLLPKSSVSTTVNGRPVTQVASQVHLVDRFSLAIWITRRVVPMVQLRTSSNSNTATPLPPPPPTIPTDLPGLLICLEQRHCVLRLSDARVTAVRLCLSAVATAAVEQTDEVAVNHQPLPPTPAPHSSEIRRLRRPKQRISTSSMTPATAALRRTIVVTFSMHELILQLDAQGRPLAECRLTSTAARFSRSTDPMHSMTTYEVCLQVHSLTIADALCGLGGDFDLLAASHRNVRLDTLSGSLNVSDCGDISSTKRHSRQRLMRGSSNNFVVTRPFFDPIGDSGEDSSTALIRVKYFQSSSGMKTSRLLDVKFRHLDLLGNLDTLVELIAFVRCVIPVSESRNESHNLNLSTTHTASMGAEGVENRDNDGISNVSDGLELSISVERLSLVLIRVKAAPEAEGTAGGSGVVAEGEEAEYSFPPSSATAERIATITLLGVHFQSEDNHNNLRVSLAGLQVLDLMEVESSSMIRNGVQHRHIFAAGRCLDPELPDAVLAWSAAKSVFTLTARCHSTSGYHIMLEVSSPVYVHKPRALHEISAWFSRLYHRNTEVGVLALRLAKSAVNSAVAAATAPPQQQQLAPSSSSLSRIGSLHAVFEQPVIVLPAGPVSPNVLIARLGRLMLRNGGSADSCSKDADGGDSLTPLRFVQLSVAHASLSALDISDERGVPRVRDTSEAVQAMLVLAHYLGLVTSPMEHSVLKDISADIIVKRQILSRPRVETESETVNWPDDFNSTETSFPFDEDGASEQASSKPELWITMSACLTQPLHVRLSKGVYHQLLQTMNNLTHFEKTGDGDDDGGSSSSSSQKSSRERINTGFDSQVPAEEVASTVMVPGLAMRFRMPLLLVETFTEMSGETHPLGLTRLSLCEFFVAASRIPTASGRNDGIGLTHAEATLASLLLENLLPGYREENRYLLYSHLPSKSQPSSPPWLRNPRRRPLAVSCPSLIESSSWTSLTDVGTFSFSKSLQRAPLSINFGLSNGEKEKGTGSKVIPSDKCRRLSSLRSGQLQHPTEEKASSGEDDQFVRIRVLLVDRGSPLFTTKYQSTPGFVDVAFSALTCYLSLHPWVLLLDFLGLGSPLTACDEFDIPTTFVTSSSSSNATLALPTRDSDFRPTKFTETPVSEAETLTVVTLSVSTFSLLLDTVPKASCPASPLLNASASRLHLRLTNHSRHIDAGGGWLHIAGRLASASVYDLTTQGRQLYPQRFLAGGGGSCGDYLVFALTKYQLPDSDVTRRAEDGKLELRLGPAYYVHTQTFLVTTIHTLDSFLQYQDLMNRVRASSEGYKVRQGAPISMRLRLDVKAEAPILVVPVSPASESVLVCNLGTLTAVNDFCWHTDVVNRNGVDGSPYEVFVGNPLQQHQQQACKHCSSNLWWCNDPAEAGSKDIMTQSFYPNSVIAKDAASTDESPCLLDRIQLTLDQIEVYIGKRHDVKDAVSVECSRVLHFNDFCILPEAAALTQLFGLSIVVERNLCGGRGQHAVPDWRLSARLRPTSPLRVGLHDYTLLRGILEHNIAAPLPTADVAATTSVLATSKWDGLIFTANENREPAYTRQPYTVLAFTFDLEDVSIYLSVPSDWPSQRHVKLTPDASFCRLDLTRSRLSYDSFSCGGHVIDLACSAVTFTDTRFENCAEPQNLFPAILSALAKPHQHHHDGDNVVSPQFRVTQVVTPMKGGIENTTSATTSSSMTFNLRSMRLILALDWLVDLHRFLTTSPMLPSSSLATTFPPPTDNRRDGETMRIGGEHNNHLRSLTIETNQQQSMPQVTSDLRVFADQTEFVIMENPAQLETNTVILSGAACFLLRSGGALSQALMHLCLHSVGLYTFTGCTDDSRAVIVEPTDLTVALTPPTTQNSHNRQSPSPTCGGLQDLLAPRADLEVRTSTLRTHFSYTDSLLFLALIDSFREQTAYAFGSPTATTGSAFTPPADTDDTSFDHSIAKLVEKGFSAEAATNALHTTGERLDKAIFVLLAPQPPNAPADPPQSRVVLWLRSLVDQLTPHVSSINFCSDFSLCLIDDCMDADVPLAEITVSDISLNWNLTGWAVGRAMGKLAVKYYNRDLSALEPAIEPFRCICHWRLYANDSPKGDRALIEVHSPDTINVNLTVALVRLTQLVIQKTQSTRLDRQLRSHRRRRRAPFVPFCLENQTGERLHFKKATASSCFGNGDEGGDWIPVEVDACVELPFQSALAATGRGQGQVQGSGRVAHGNLTTTPRLFLRVEGWTSAYPVALDRLGVFWRTIRSQQRQNYKLSPVTRLVIEIVRRGSAQNLVIVRSGLTLTNRLSPHLALEVGLAYAPSLPPYSANVSAIEASSTAAVVMRSGVRLAFGETRALPLSLAAHSNEDGGERLCFRPVRVTNGGTDDTSRSDILFDWSQQLCLQHFDNRGIAEVELRFPTSSKEVMDWRRLTNPGDFDECVMVCRKLKSGSEIGLYSATVASPKRSASRPPQKQLPWLFCVTAVRDSFPPDPLFREVSLVLPGHHLTVGPALRVVNLLPCDLTYFIEGTPIRSRLPANRAASVFEVSCTDVLRFGVHLENFQHCKPINIPPATFSDTVLINLFDQFGRLLQLKAEVYTRALGARHITLSAVCWLINHSGLPLVFAAEAPSSLASFPEWQSPGSPEHRLLAAGQSEEQEVARLALPLLFSPSTAAAISGNSTGVSTRGGGGAGVGGSGGGRLHLSWSLQVRLGALYQPSEGGGGNSGTWLPRWSTPVALNKSGEALMLRLKAVGMESRPDLLYSVGVEIRKGVGLHCSTTIVTFVPRFMISNQTNFQLQFAQQFCLDSTTHKPMDIHPQCNLPFHWPRQDLDQLLCFRALIGDESWLSDHQTGAGLISTHWSGGVQIDKPRSYHIMLRMPTRPQTGPYTSSISSPAESLFLRIDVVLRSATLFVIISDATHLPPPYRIENCSPVALYYQQSIDNGGFEAPPPSSPASTRGSSRRWFGSVRLNRLLPRSMVNYAPEEPLLPPRLSVGVQGDLNNFYDLSVLGPGSRLVYDNCVYIGISGVAGDDSRDLPDSDINQDSGGYCPVLDVIAESEKVRRVVLSKKQPGDRSQLWYLSSQGYLVHEGSTAPQAPVRRRGRLLSKRNTWVLDVDTSEMAMEEAIIRCPLDSSTLENFELGVLCLARLSSRRKNTQTWRFDRGFLINAASFCVQARRNLGKLGAASSSTIFVARPRIRGVSSGGRRGVKGERQSLVSESLGAAQIFYTWLRPGSGSLHVEVLTDGPVRVLRISDPQELNQIIPTASPHHHKQPFIASSYFRLLLDLPSGIGVSVISARCEELCYASLLSLRFALERYYPGSGSIDVGQEVTEVEVADDDDAVFVDVSDQSRGCSSTVGNEVVEALVAQGRPVEQLRLQMGKIQVDNQIAGASLPVLLFHAAPAKSSNTATDSRTTSKSVVEGRLLRPSEGGDDINGRELERLFQTGNESVRTASKSDQVATTWPNLIMRSLRLLHTGWKGEIFALLEVQLNRMVMQAEEILLLKLIQFGRHFWASTPAATMSTEGAKSIDFLQQAVLEAEGSYSRQISPPSILSDDFLYFDRLRVLFSPIRVTMQTAEGRLGPEFYDVHRLLPKLMSFTDADIRLGEFARDHCLESSRFLMEQLSQHFEARLRAQTLRIFGSVDVLGNPLGLMSDISSGICDLADMDFSGLVRNVAHGVGDSAAKVVGSVSQLVHTLSMDETHQLRRRVIMGSPRRGPGSGAPLTSPSSIASAYVAASRAADGEVGERLDDFEVTALSSAKVAEGNRDTLFDQTAPFRAGLRGFVHGVVGGVTSMVTQPIHGACEEDGLKGFVYGVGRGLLGTVTKPVGGVLDLVSGAMTSLREAARPSSTGRPRRMRPRRALSMPLRAYSLGAAVGQLLLRRLSVHPFSGIYEPAAVVIVSLDDLKDSEGCSVNRLLKASRQQWEDERPEMVICVLKCQSTTVSVIVTDRALWCVRNFTLQGVKRTSESFHGNENRDATNVMFVVPYFYLKSVRLSQRIPGKTKSSGAQGFVPSGAAVAADSSYLEFQLERRQRELRFDRAEWAEEVLAEVSEAHFRYVQSLMELRRDRPVDLALQTHPIALPFGPPLISTSHFAQIGKYEECEDEQKL